MKKIFGLFAAAVLAATGLTCCGGGGGSDSSFAYKIIEITPPVSNVGSMYIRVNDPIPEAPGMYNARYGFGADKGDHHGSFEVESQTTNDDGVKTAKVNYYIRNYAAMTNDQDALGFYGSLNEDVRNNMQNGNQPVNVDFPFMSLVFEYDPGSQTSGHASFTVLLPVPEDMTDEQKGKLGIEPGDKYYEVELKGGRSRFTITQR